MKFHRTLVEAITGTLQRIFNEGVYADKAVEQMLKQNPRWGSRDRRFIAETTYGMVRWWRLIGRSAALANPQTNNDFWNFFAVWQIITEKELPDWEEFSGIDTEKIMLHHKQAKQTRKYRESVPDWLDEIAVAELGEAVWEKELPELNKEASVVLRVNTLKTNQSKLQRQLAEQNIETEINNNYPSALLLNKRQNLHILKEYKEGLFEIQDASSQLIAPFMELEANSTVIDACAGAGGKSLHMAALLKNTGRIISMDVEDRKLTELKKRSERAGVSIIQTQLANPQNLAKLRDTADRLLLDVPCSGLGVIRRNPDAKWKLSLDFINEIKKTQQKIISEYSAMLKPGGLLVYATCSILPSENQHQVTEFLKQHADFELIEDQKIFPSEGFDGFYMAKMRRKK